MQRSKLTGVLMAVALIGGATQTVQAADTFKIDPAHAFVYYKANHFGWSNNMGRFNKVSGTFTIDEANPGKSKVNVVIDAASVDTNHEARDKHLRSPDFFNTKEFPQITFTSTKVEKIAGRKGRLTGNLTMLGVTKPVSFEFTWNRMSPHFRNKDEIHTGFSAQVTINRADWGMKKFPDQAIGHNITLFLEIEGLRKK
ncbi:MAG: YceI family protein [Alphaproteobacteria bacterium]|nr:YceI family protein [Alphaproteobacteria bacterium]